MAKEVVKSYPTKTLFIDILTQDIDVKDCIMDLLDNSIDSYKRHELKKRKSIHLIITKNKFEILDTCGGIEMEILKNRAFVFGVDELKREKKSLGLYGIGMKRSIFKIGKNIDLSTDDGKFYNTLKIDVDKWKLDKNWDFEINSIKSKQSTQSGFTKILVTNLHEEIQLKFDSKVFLDDLKKSIHIMYTRFLRQNVDILVNKEKIKPFEIEIISDNKYKPARHKENYDGIDIDIICYIEPQTGRSSAKHEGRRGWNIFTNDRLIIIDDTSPITGWEAGKGLLPNYHPIYNPFRGLVFLESDDPSKLPLNTSKNGLNAESKIYNYILKKMVNTARPVVNYLTKTYSGEKEQTDDIEENIKTKGEAGTKVFIDNLPNQNTKFSAPAKKSLNTATIKFDRPKDIIEKVKRHLRAKSNGEVGIKTFEYYVKSEEIK